MLGGGAFGKLLILSFEDNEEHIINRILSCLNEETEVLQHQIADEETLKFDGLYIDEHKRIVVREDNEIELTYTEFEILLLLVQNIGRVFSKEQIYNCVWKEPYFGDHNIVMSHIRNLRGKIEDNPSKPIYIQTVWGVGYRFNKNLSSGL
jgi:DNA-binding response regulator